MNYKYFFYFCFFFVLFLLCVTYYTLLYLLLIAANKSSAIMSTHIVACLLLYRHRQVCVAVASSLLVFCHCQIHQLTFFKILLLLPRLVCFFPLFLFRLAGMHLPGHDT